MGGFKGLCLGRHNVRSEALCYTEAIGGVGVSVGKRDISPFSTKGVCLYNIIQPNRHLYMEDCGEVFLDDEFLKIRISVPKEDMYLL
jgi:hypothetical protein